MGALLTTWWSSFSGYFVAAASVLTGNFQPLPLLAALGIVFAVVGIGLAVAWRVTQALRLLVLLVAALLTPLVIISANHILGWLGMLFAVLGGAIILLVGTGVIANGADRRLPIWLIGIFLILFAGISASLGGAFYSLTV